MSLSFKSVVLSGVLLATVAVTSSQEAAPLRTYPLPAAAAFPEGIARSATTNTWFTASGETGAVVAINPKDGSSRVVVPAGVLVPAGTTTFPVALGMKVDAANRLWIAGGRTGRMFVVDAASGALLKQVRTPGPAPSLINDVAVVGSTAYFTDTLAPMLWRMVAGPAGIGNLEPWLDLTKSPVMYDPAAPNLNGIVATPDGQSLIVVQMGKGKLFRVDLTSRWVYEIEVPGADLTGGDGLVLYGAMLFVVRQPAAEIVTVSLSPDMATGKVVSRFRDPALAWPATAILADGSLIVVNTQFNTRATKTEKVPFTLLAVPLTRLGVR